MRNFHVANVIDLFVNTKFSGWKFKLSVQKCKFTKEKSSQNQNYSWELTNVNCYRVGNWQFNVVD